MFACLCATGVELKDSAEFKSWTLLNHAILCVEGYFLTGRNGAVLHGMSHARFRVIINGEGVCVSLSFSSVNDETPGRHLNICLYWW